MNTKLRISHLTWMFMGLVIGFAFTFYYQVGVRAKYAREHSEMDLDYYLNRMAMRAYAVESRPVAIYALSEYLANAETLTGKPRSYFVTTAEPFWMVRAHGMLAKLYADNGETNLSAQHLDLALRFARAAGSYPNVTNQAALWELIGPNQKTDQ